jgi:hypothetical protein
VSKQKKRGKFPPLLISLLVNEKSACYLLPLSELLFAEGLLPTPLLLDDLEEVEEDFFVEDEDLAAELLCAGADDLAWLLRLCAGADDGLAELLLCAGADDLASLLRFWAGADGLAELLLCSGADDLASLLRF